MIPPFVHANAWSPGSRFKSWPLLRAYEITDGVRVWHDGSRAGYEAWWTRSGNQIDTGWRGPKKLTLEGEIVGLDPSAVAGVVAAGARDARWKDLRFAVVDAPELKGDFDQRRAALEKKKLPDFCEVVPVRSVPSEAALEEYRREVEQKGGRGLMLRLGSGAADGQIWKLRISPEFVAEVTGHEEGSGKNAGRLGVLLCALDDGVKFRVSAGLTDEVRDNPPAVGSQVVCRCSARTAKGNPKSPVFVRVEGATAAAKPAAGKAARAASPAPSGAGEKLSESSARRAAGLGGDSPHKVSKRLEMIDVGRLQPYQEVFGKNPQIHGPADLARIRKNIEEVGWLCPIVIDEQNTILDGNGRLMVAQQMGLPKVPCLRVSGLSVGKKRVAGLHINLTGKLGDADKDALKYQLRQAVDECGVEELTLEVLGYAEGYGADLLQGVSAMTDQGLEELGNQLGIFHDLEHDEEQAEADAAERAYKGVRKIEGNLRLRVAKSEDGAESFRTPLPYHGGKSGLVPVLRPLAESLSAPEHGVTMYYEAFAGGLALLWSFRHKFEVEVVSDRMGVVVDFWEVMKTRYDEFQELATLRGLHSEKHFKRAQSIVTGKATAENQVESAWSIWYATVLAGSFDARQGFMVGYDVNKAALFHSRLDKMTRDMMRRLEGLTIMESDAVQLIKRFGARSNVLIYADPPYCGANMGVYDGYTQEEFDALLAALAGCHAKFILSSYDNPSLDAMTKKHGWFTARIRMHSGAADNHTSGPREKVEVITTNFPSPFAEDEE